MSTTALITLAFAVVLVAIGIFLLWQRRRSESLRKQFGPEYKRAVNQYGDQRKADWRTVFLKHDPHWKDNGVAATTSRLKICA